MRAAVGLVFLVACGDAASVVDDDGSGAGLGDASPSGDDAGPIRTEPTCRTAEQPTEGFSERIHDAWCFGLAVEDTFECHYTAETDSVRCFGRMSAYDAMFDFDDSAEVFDADSDEKLAELYRSTDHNVIVIDWVDGRHGRCARAADTSTLCIDP